MDRATFQRAEKLKNSIIQLEVDIDHLESILEKGKIRCFSITTTDGAHNFMGPFDLERSGLIHEPIELTPQIRKYLESHLTLMKAQLDQRELEFEEL